MSTIHVIAHTHWDFEWYFTRQHARVQFAYHMNEVLRALSENQLDYYLLDGQMSILDDYLSAQPDQRTAITEFVRAGRLFIGPWYTQIDEMVTAGESIVRNLQLGHKLANELGGVMPVGYLPDSFGQGTDMPKIYNGFDIYDAVFWRGMPKEKEARYFYWRSDDESTVLVANIKNGYYAGVDLVTDDDPTAVLQRISTDTTAQDLVLPVGGDQRPVDVDLKAHIAAANAKQKDVQLVESTYPAFFAALAQTPDLPTYSGEFVDARDSKIHRGIYSSRADLKQVYDRLERTMIAVVEPLMAMASAQGIPAQDGLVADIWKTIARGQAHDSSGGCNSDLTNQDILHRGEAALELAESIRDYLLRKMASNPGAPGTVYLFNPQAVPVQQMAEVTLATREPGFTLHDEKGTEVQFEVLKQETVDAAIRRRDPAEQNPDVFYQTTIVFPAALPATDWQAFHIKEQSAQLSLPSEAPAAKIENGRLRLEFADGALTLTDLQTKHAYRDLIRFEDGGDEGDTYDFSPAFKDWILSLDLHDAVATAQQGSFQSELTLRGQWLLPADLAARAKHDASVSVAYELSLTLKKDTVPVGIHLSVNNQVDDHRLRLVINTGIKATNSYSDTPFGVSKRPVEDPHLANWKAIDYHEEPTALRPFIHFANTHDAKASVTFLSQGAKAFQLIGPDYTQMAITAFRGVGFLGRPDTLRRPGDASGLQTLVVPTPDSQLRGVRTLDGAIVVGEKFDPAEIQAMYQTLSVGTLAHQNQTLDRFTTPIGYFMIDKAPQALAHLPLVEVSAPDVVISSLALSPDNKGWVLRVYNPSKEALAQPGQLHFAQGSNLLALNLNNVAQTTLATNVKDYSLDAMRPGEIRTIGIFPVTL